MEKGVSNTASVTSNSHRRVLMAAICALCKDQGFNGASKACIESLAELMQAYVTELCLCCREFCELSHRTVPDMTDVRQALVELGSDINAIKAYALLGSKEKLKGIQASKHAAESKPFNSGLSKINRPTYISAHYPEFPDAHAFVKTPSLREPLSEYRTVRERVAAQKSETEAALVKFLARTRPAATNLFEKIDVDLYPLAEAEVDQYPYLRGLLPCQNEMIEFDETNNDEKLSSFEADNGDESSPLILSPESKERLHDNPYFREAKLLKSSNKSV